jgi:membrane-bound inhibitor of C-type lysozyme
MRYADPPFPSFAATIAAILLAGLLGACADAQRKEAEEAAKNTFACQLDGQRLIMKFEMGEARLLMPDGDRVILYQVPMGSGIRYTNGNLDLRGKGMDLQLVRNGNPSPLVGCEPYLPPK